MIGLVTYAAVPNLTDDDRPLLAALGALAIEARPILWDDPKVRWTDFSALVLRSCWDYHLRAGEFRKWLSLLERMNVPLWNPVPLVRWNMHKFYLRDLAAKGLLIPATHWADQGSGTTLSAIMREHKWTQAIVKPAISASATDTWRTTSKARADGVRFAELVERSDVLVQEVVPEITTEGEWSLMFIGGAFSHSTIKRPSPGDFRVQTEFGGSAEPRPAPPEIIAAGERLAGHIPTPWLFARIDGVMTGRGFMLMEIECIEPLMFFDHAPGSHGRFAAALAACLDP